ncbi:alpha/beta hydrolase [Gordonia polyisoprenivorans]|uniref:alpha/beta hydrolase n=1 Tax=Gordonia polyisoprenivorans TaxID=84595 RepID=UPI001FCBD664|nr:alpha/beta hydrolase-fold protein [Gordonia polyisoprenivorans]
MRRHATTKRSTSRRVAAAVLAVCLASSGAAVVGAGAAHAVNPDRLRSGCVWRTAEDQANHVQTCSWHSESLGREVTVQVRPSDQQPGQTERGVYFLDGLGSTPAYSSWSLPIAGAVENYSPADNLVMPTGGSGEWMTNWRTAPTGAASAPQWETFLSSELPSYLYSNFDVGQRNNAIVGVSMSAAPAIITGLDHPETFSVMRAYSGYYETDSPLGWLAIPLIQISRSGITNGLWGMWGAPLSPGNSWAHNSVARRLVTEPAPPQTIIVSTGNGTLSPAEIAAQNAATATVLREHPEQLPAFLLSSADGVIVGGALESAAFGSTLLLQAATTAVGLPVRYRFSSGGHNWLAWGDDAHADAEEVDAALDAAAAGTSTTSTQSPSVAPTSPTPASLVSPANVERELSLLPATLPAPVRDAVDTAATAIGSLAPHLAPAITSTHR